MPGYTKGTAFTQFTKPLNLKPSLSDPTYPLRVLVCRQTGVNVPIPGAPILTVEYAPAPGAEMLLLMEPWEDIP